MDQVSDEELKKVMGDFLEQGHVENIAAMYRQAPLYYQWTGDLLNDDRFTVRLGMSVLFEELQEQQPEKTVLAIPSLARLLNSQQEHIRGEALSILAIIGSDEAYQHIEKLADDPSPQIRELVTDILSERAA